ncbi:MAG TPA: hypothetical protein VJ023_18545, partial [Pyrinomonadaceae bacterium]|nr:hypothetical protein [Pyrinomonadaceae bacterium]
SDSFGLFLRFLYAPAVAYHPANHPKGTDTNTGGAMHKYRSVLWVVCNLQKSLYLFVLWLTKRNWDVEIDLVSAAALDRC